jgi:sarcosine oxidase subunit beta
MMETSPVPGLADLVVIGGGIIGCWTALRLARKGVRVTILEKEEIAHQGSGRNRGNVRVQLREAVERDLINRSLVLWRDLEEVSRTTVEYRVTGNLLVSYDDNLTADFDIEVRRHREMGYDAHVVQGESLRELVPGISPDIASGFLTTEDGHVNGQLATWEVAAQAKAAGVRFLRGTEALSIAVDSGKVSSVRTSDGDIATAQVLVAAAGDSVRLLRPLGIEAPITLALHQILVTEKLPFVTGPYLRCASPRISFCQTASGSLLLGLGPARAIGADENPVVEPDKVEAIMRETLRLVPPLKRARIVRSWAGLFDLTPDGRAIVGPAGEVDGLWIAAGFCGHGMAISPALTESLAAAISGEAPGISLAAFAPGRFRDGVAANEGEQQGSRVSHLGNLIAPPIQ